jgi:ATP-dependent Lon protease
VPVKREVAMTGEITLRGRVLPVGGIKEKVLAAHRGGITTVLFPKDNEKDLRDIPGEVRDALTLIPVEHMDEVLRAALRLDQPDSFLANGERTPDTDSLGILADSESPSGPVAPALETPEEDEIPQGSHDPFLSALPSHGGRESR